MIRVLSPLYSTPSLAHSQTGKITSLIHLFEPGEIVNSFAIHLVVSPSLFGGWASITSRKYVVIATRHIS